MQVKGLIRDRGRLFQVKESKSEKRRTVPGGRPGDRVTERSNRKGLNALS